MKNNNIYDKIVKAISNGITSDLKKFQHNTEKVLELMEKNKFNAILPKSEDNKFPLFKNIKK